MPERPKYAALGVLFVNVSIGGTLTVVRRAAGADGGRDLGLGLAFMLADLRLEGGAGGGASTPPACRAAAAPAPAPAAPHEAPRRARAAGRSSLIHLAFLAAVVLLAHHPVLFLGLFLLFLGFTQAYERHQDPLILKEALLVGVLPGRAGGAGRDAAMVAAAASSRRWRRRRSSSARSGLTAITDNAALTYLGSLIAGLSREAKYMLVAGAVAGGGLTVIANAPNPAGVALLQRGFDDESIGALGCCWARWRPRRSRPRLPAAVSGGPLRNRRRSPSRASTCGSARRSPAPGALAHHAEAAVVAAVRAARLVGGLLGAHQQEHVAAHRPGADGGADHHEQHVGEQRVALGTAEGFHAADDADHAQEGKHHVGVAREQLALVPLAKPMRLTLST